MTSAHPPDLATRLLALMDAGPSHQALVGDLVEQYRAGRSRAWFWRQTVAALACAMARNVRGHKLLALRAIVIGWVLYFAFSFPVNYAARQLRGVFLTWLSSIGEYSFASTILATWLASTPLVYTACFVAGWLVARLHRRHALAMICFFSASVLVVEYSAITIGFLLFGNPRQPGYPPFALLGPVVLAIGRPLSVLLGGLTWVLTQRAQRAPAAL